MTSRRLSHIDELGKRDCCFRHQAPSSSTVQEVGAICALTSGRQPSPKWLKGACMASEAASMKARVRATRPKDALRRRSMAIVGGHPQFTNPGPKSESVAYCATPYKPHNLPWTVLFPGSMLMCIN